MEGIEADVGQIGQTVERLCEIEKEASPEWNELEGLHGSSGFPICSLTIGQQPSGEVLIQKEEEEDGTYDPLSPASKVSSFYEELNTMEEGEEEQEPRSPIMDTVESVSKEDLCPQEEEAVEGLCR